MGHGIFEVDLFDGSLKGVALATLGFFKKFHLELLFVLAYLIALTVKNPSADYFNNSVSVVCVLLIALLATIKRRLYFGTNAIGFMMLFWLGLLIALCVISPTVNFSLIYASFLCFIPLFVLSGVFKCLNIKVLYLWLKLITALIALYCIYEFVLTGERANFFVIDPNFVGGVLGFIFVGMFFELLSVTNKQGCLLTAVLSFVVAAGMAATQSRSALIFSILIIVLLTICLRKFGYKRRVIAALVLIFMLGLSWYGIELLTMATEGKSLIEDRVNSAGRSIGARFDIWDASVRMFLDAPVLGKGLGSFYTFYPDYRTEFLTTGTFAHNDYLQFFSEGGIVLGGFYIVISFIYFIFFVRNLLRCCSGDIENNQSRNSFGIQAGALLLMAQGGVNFVFYIAGSSLLLALGFSAVFQDKSQKELKSNNKFGVMMGGSVVIVIALFIVFSASVWWSSSAAKNANIHTKLALKLSEETINNLEMHVELNPFIYRPLMPLSENAILSVGSKMSDDERKILKARMAKYYKLTSKHMNLRCLSGLLAAEFAAEFPEEKGLAPGTKEQILQQTYEKQPKCELYYNLLIGPPVPVVDKNLN